MERMEGCVIGWVKRAGTMVGDKCLVVGGKMLWDDEALHSTFVGKVGEQHWHFSRKIKQQRRPSMFASNLNCILQT